jgi:soluble lytic murein transglycosylase-like protein
VSKRLALDCLVCTASGEPERPRLTNSFKTIYADRRESGKEGRTAAVSSEDPSSALESGFRRVRKAGKAGNGALAVFGNHSCVARRTQKISWIRRWLILAPLLAASLGSVPARADCLDEAAAYWGVPAWLARAIAQHESGMRPKAVGVNTNGSRDIGLFQINSWWLPTLKRYGIEETDLFDACKNAYVGNWILAQNISRFGFNWTAIGAYNASTPEKRDNYARKIYGEIRKAMQYQSVDAAQPGPTASR